jgi:hypothetical protein
MRTAWSNRIYDERGYPIHSGESVEGVGHVVSEPTDEAPCPLHPEWKPERWLENQPRPYECPKCKLELSRARKRTGSSAEETHQPGPPYATPSESYSERARFALERYEARQRARGVVVPGSSEELDAVARSDDLRREVVAADHRGRGRPSGRYLCSRIEGGREISFYEQRIGGRKTVVQVGPS